MIVIQFAGPWAAIYDNFPYSWLLPGQDWTPIGLKESLYPWKMIKMVLGSSASQSKPLWVTTIGFDGPRAAFFDNFPHFRPFSGQDYIPRSGRMNILEYINQYVTGVTRATLFAGQTGPNSSLWTLSRHFLWKPLIFSHFWARNEAHRPINVNM